MKKREQLELSTMNKETAENRAILEKWLQKRRSRDDGEKEEINMQVEAEEHAVHEEIEEKNETAEAVPEKEKKARVHSVFSLVRSQIRTQAGLDGQRMGILDVVNQITKELEKNKKEQEESAPTVEISSSEENAAQKETEEEQMTQNGENMNERGGDLCVALMEEILLNLESLKKDLREDLAQLRREMQSYTDQALCGLETRLTNLLRIQVLAHTTPSALPRNHTVESMETKKHRPPSMPPLGTCRRRVLNRTMTTITPKTCLPLSLGPRSNSEPLGGWGAENGSVTSNGAQMLLRRDEAVSHPPGPLPPALPPAQKGKKALRSRTRIGKPTC